MSVVVLPQGTSGDLLQRAEILKLHWFQQSFFPEIL
jgi:hypothetical protein